MVEHTTGVPAPGLRRYLAAAVLVRTADEGARVALLLLALSRSGDAAMGGLLVAAVLVPQVVAAPAVGLLTDRVRRGPRVLAAAAVLFGGSLAAAALTVGRAPLPVTVAVLLLGGCCGPALTGGLTSQLRLLVRDAALPRAHAADSLTYSVAGIGGPALAAVLAGVLSATTATVVLGGGAVLGATLLATLPALRAENGTPARPPLRAGVVLVVTDPVLRVVTAGSSLAQLGVGGVAVVAAVLSGRQHAPAATGGLLAAVAVGALVGSLLSTWRPVRAERAARTALWSLVGVGAPLAAAAALSVVPSGAWLPVLAALFALSGLSLGPGTAALFSVRQQRAPEALQAQVFTLGAGLKLTMAAAGSALAGLLAGLPSPLLLLLAGGVPILAGTAALLALRPTERRAAEHQAAERQAAEREREPLRGPGATAAAPSA